MKKLTLCFIFGNVAEYLPRFLENFKALTPHLVAVRAIGNQEPDESWAICEAAGCKMGEFKNSAHPDWPHVEDFSAARQLSFDLADADSDFLMWADTDDIILKESVEKIHDALERMDAKEDVMQLPYRILHMDLVLWRERIIRPGKLKWRYPVHEHLYPVWEPTDDKPLYVTRCAAEIIHGPKRSKQGSNDRNLRILESCQGDNISLTYHLFQEYISMGALEKALPLATKLNEHPDCGRDEKFEMFLMLGAATAEDSEKSRLFFEQALHSAPERAEAYVELANWHLNVGNPLSALAYARASTALPLPPDCWNARRWAYGWNRDDILRQAQRVNRQPVTPQQKCRISVIHPTCRPIDAIARRRQTLMRAAKPELVEYTFGVNRGDVEVCSQLARFGPAYSDAVPEGYSSAVANYNAAFHAATCEIIVAAQDDIEFPDGWDYQILKAFEHVPKNRPTVLHLHDGFRDDKIMVVMCVNKAWKNKHGDLLNQAYDGWFSDSEFSLRAYEAGEVIDGRHIKCIHWHPAFTGAESDAAYMRQQNPEAYARNKAIFNERNPKFAQP